MPVTNVKTRWVDGNLVFYDASDDIICTFDGTNRAVVFPAGADLDIVDGLETTDLADGVVTFAKAAVFVSAEVTATGSAQNVAHGLGAVPAGVLIVPTEHPGTPDTGAFDIAEGTHTTTNVVCTVTVNVKFKVLAWA